MDDSFSDALQQILTDQCTADTVRAIEAGGPWAGLWAKLEESGFADAMRGEEHGGAGLGHAAGVVVPEHDGRRIERHRALDHDARVHGRRVDRAFEKHLMRDDAMAVVEEEHPEALVRRSAQPAAEVVDDRSFHPYCIVCMLINQFE